MAPGTPRETDELRQEMARLDAKLVAILDERARLSRQVRENRKNQAPTIPLGDRAALRELVERGSGDMPKDALREVLHAVFAAGLSLELPVTVAFVGTEGGAGHAAARRRFGSGDSNLVTVETADDALEEVSRKRAEFAVVPFETSVEGPLQPTIQALVARDLRIVEMLDDDFTLHLLSRDGRLAGVSKVYATAGDQLLCHRFVDKVAPRALVAQVATPRLACQLAAEEDGAAAIAGESFAAPFGLSIAVRDVRDADSARVRYAVAGTRPSGRTAAEATSLVFTVQDAPGSLLDVLRVFAERGIALTKIHSHPVDHPIDGPAWSYLFYMEVAGHFTDRPLVTAFEEVKRMTRLFKLLGSYPAG